MSFVRFIPKTLQNYNIFGIYASFWAKNVIFLYFETIITALFADIGVKRHFILL